MDYCATRNLGLLTRAQHWCLRRWYRLREKTIDRRKGVLVYVGLHKGREFDLLFRRYTECYAFEANPDLYALLREKYSAHPHVKLFNLAASDSAGTVTFNVSDNDGVSSSLGNFEEEWDNYKNGQVRMVKSVSVQSVHLGDFLAQQGVQSIDDYYSDIQGMDLAVLATMQRYIDARQIGAITVETAREGRRNIYRDLPDNSESGFERLLGRHYRLVAIGYGVLADYWFGDIGNAWEMDCKWRRR
jgi:FkbM family methyltransferase